RAKQALSGHEGSPERTNLCADDRLAALVNDDAADRRELEHANFHVAAILAITQIDRLRRAARPQTAVRTVGVAGLLGREVVRALGQVAEREAPVAVRQHSRILRRRADLHWPAGPGWPNRDASLRRLRRG